MRHKSVLSETPCIKGTRIPVRGIADMLANGDSAGAIHEALPVLSQAKIKLAAFCARAYGLRAEAYIDTGDQTTTKEAFDQLHEKRKRIEQTVGEELDWDRLYDKQGSRISLYFPDEIRVTDEQRWPEVRPWLAQAMGRMRDAFNPVLVELRA